MAHRRVVITQQFMNLFRSVVIVCSAHHGEMRF